MSNKHLCNQELALLNFDHLQLILGIQKAFGCTSPSGPFTQYLYSKSANSMIKHYLHGMVHNYSNISKVM